MPAMLLTSCKRQPYDDNIEILGNRVIECMWNEGRGTIDITFTACIDNKPIDAEWAMVVNSGIDINNGYSFSICQPIDKNKGIFKINTDLSSNDRSKTLYKTKIQAKYKNYKPKTIDIYIHFNDYIPDKISFQRTELEGGKIDGKNEYKFEKEFQPSDLIGDTSDTYKMKLTNEKDSDGVYTNQYLNWTIKQTNEHVAFETVRDSSFSSSFNTLHNYNIPKLIWDFTGVEPTDGIPIVVVLEGQSINPDLKVTLIFNFFIL